MRVNCLFCTLAISLFGLVGALCGQSTSAADAADAADDLPSVMELQQAYVAANGGPAGIEALSSLATSGVITNGDGQEFEFKLYKKRPGLMRLHLDMGRGEMVRVFDGSRGFEALSRGGQATEVVELGAEESARMRLDSSMDGPFFALRSRLDRLEVVREAEVGGAPAYEIVVGEEAGSPYDRIWLCKAHGQEVKLSRRLEGEAVEGIVEEIYFSDFEQIDSVWFAKLSRYVRDGELVQSIRIEDVRSNVGLFDSFFEKPTL